MIEISDRIDIYF